MSTALFLALAGDASYIYYTSGLLLLGFRIVG
jgi:hypothetical protein